MKKRHFKKGAVLSDSVYTEVAVPLPIFRTFTYEVPETLIDLIHPGKRVLVPFGNRRVTGYVLALKRGITLHDQVKKILDVLDDIPLFPPSIIPFYRWVADYYLYPLGEVIKCALPGGLNITSIERISLNEKGRQVLDLAGMSPLERKVLNVLETEKGLTLKQIQQRLGERAPRAVIYNLKESGWVEIRQELKPGRVRPKMERYVRIGDNIPCKDSLSTVRRTILEVVSDYGEISISALKKVVPTAGQLMKRMASDQYLKIIEKPVYRDPFGEPIEQDTHAPILTSDQKSVVGEIKNALGGGFSTYLLYGITGSGKTEVYMQAVASVLERGEEALILVPEIALISQMERRFRARFGEKVAILHSGLSEGERYDQWLRIVRKEVQIAIGARSAVFAPFEHLGLVVVDEEHDDSYKQETGLRYHGRDLAIVRAKMAGAVALLGSATPSVQSFYNVKTNKYKGLNLLRRIEDRALPEVVIVDLRKEEERTRTIPIITSELKEEMSGTLMRGEQILLFLNRRGYAPYPVCARCGKVICCKNCDISLTFHHEAKVFKCHYCGFTEGMGARCRHCSSSRIRLLGMGTERVEETVRKMFPEARVARMDRDTTSRKGALIKILKGLRHKEIDILIGTQMVTKGHDFPNITLVGIICADLSLNFPDFRSGERTFQVLAQVAGRAGRGEKPGRVILQTYNPEHFCIETAKKQDYIAFYEREIGYRNALRYPPLSRLVLIRVEGRDEERAAQCARSLGNIVRDHIKKRREFQEIIEVLGPTNAPLPRLQNQYRWQLLLKGSNAGSLHELTQVLVQDLERSIRKKGIRIMVDVDPVFML
nr:primosomal protein N' [Desulfobacterales bacterium]